MKANVLRIAVRRSIGRSDRARSYRTSRGLSTEVLADDPDRAPVDEVPGVDPIVAADVQLEQLAASVVGRLLAARLPVHDADGPDANLVDRALQQPLDLSRLHVHELFGEREDLTHPDADEDIGFVGLEVPLVASLLFRRTQLFEPPLELRG